MAIAEPFCRTYKPIVRADGSCYFEEPSDIQECGATEENVDILYWDSQFNPVKRNASIVTEFNLVSIFSFLSISTLLRFASVTCGA